jgi:hypothetical protein
MVSTSDPDALKAELRKVSAAAMKAKLDLHDLSEELPLRWEAIPEVAKAAYDSYLTLQALRAALGSQPT